jgi:DNA-binding transcriptional MerR regulator
MSDVLINEKTDGFLMIDNNFLRDWIKVIGIGPAMLYLQLLSYCYGKKDIAFPSLKTLAATMGVSVKTIVVYRKILVSYGLIKKVIRRKDENGSYQSSMYQLVRFDNNLSREEEIDEDEPVVSEVIDAGKDSNRKSDFTEANDNTSKELKDLGVSTSGIKHLLSSYPESVIRKKLYLLRKKNLHNPGAYLLSVLRNDYAKKEETPSSSDEATATEIDEINRNERITRRRYYQKMDQDALPRQELLKWIQKIKEQLKE